MFTPLSQPQIINRRPRRLQVLAAALLLLLPLGLVRAQIGTDSTGTNGKHVIQGRIFYPSGRTVDSRLKVRLEGTNTGALSVVTDGNGHFTFRGLSPGRYDVIVEGGEDYETARDSVFIDTDARSRRLSLPSFTRTYSVTFHLQLKNSSRDGAKLGVLNAALANVPETARGLYMKALEASRANNAAKAVELLKSALSYHPDFAIALNELGVQYLKLGKADKAAEVLRSALRLAPDNATARLNYGIALLNKKEFGEAEAQLREVIKKNDSAPTAHMYLGITLLNLRNYDEAEKELRRAITMGGGSLSPAHYYLGGIYWRKKDYKRAADELETYLRLAPNAPDAERVRATIKELRSK